MKTHQGGRFACVGGSLVDYVIAYISLYSRTTTFAVKEPGRILGSSLVESKALDSFKKKVDVYKEALLPFACRT